MKNETFVAARRICDHIKAVGGMEKVLVDESLVLSVSAARQRYFALLDDQKQAMKEKEKGQKRKSIEDEIDDLKVKTPGRRTVS